MLLRQYTEKNVVYWGRRMKIERRMPTYCLYTGLKEDQTKKLKGKKENITTNLGFGQKVENVLKNNHIT